MAILANTSANNILSKLPDKIKTSDSFIHAVAFQTKYQSASGMSDFKLFLLLGLEDKKPAARIVTALKRNGEDVINDQIYDGANSIPTDQYESTSGFKIFAKQLLDSSSRQFAENSAPTILVPARTFNLDFFNAAIPPEGYYGAPRPWAKTTHKGIDYMLTSGDAVFATHDGEVREVFFDKNAGYTVTINHDSTITLTIKNETIKGTLHTRSLHAGANLVKVGQEVSAETQIQSAGETGNASGVGIMTHLEVRLVNKEIDMLAAPSVDPNILLEKGIMVPSVDWRNLLVTWSIS